MNFFLNRQYFHFLEGHNFANVLFELDSQIYFHMLNKFCFVFCKNVDSLASIDDFQF